MFKKAWEYKKIRFLCIGLFNTIVDFTILNILVVALKFPDLIANTISVSIAASISYFLNHHLVFRYPNPPSFKGYLKFFAVTVVGVIIIQNIVIAIIKPSYIDLVRHSFSSFGHENEIALNLAKVSAVLVGMVWNYCMYSIFVFKKHGSEAPKDPVI